jgi:predicted nucleotidyltransferase
MLPREFAARPQEVAQEVARLARLVLGSDIEIMWFGSWTKGAARPSADIDIALLGSSAFPPERLAELRTLIDNLATLHEIDLVDLHTVGETFRDEVLHHGVRL